MSTTALLVILVASGDARSVTTAALRQTIVVALGRPDVQIQAAAGLPTDEEALRLEKEVGAQASATVVWDDSSRSRVRIRVHLPHPGRWLERELSFAPADTLSERGRAAAFALTAMLPDPSPAPAPAPAPAAAIVAPAAPALPARAPPAPTSGSPGPWAVTVAAVASGGLGGDETLGVSVAGELFVRPALAPRLSAAVRYGDVDGFSGTDLTVTAGAGASWWALAPAVGRSLSLGVRADALAIYHQLTLTRSGQTGGAESHGRLLPALDLVLVGSWRLAQQVEILAAAGGCLSLTALDLQVGGRVVQSLGPLSAVAELGLRLRF